MNKISAHGAHCFAHEAYDKGLELHPQQQVSTPWAGRNDAYIDENTGNRSHRQSYQRRGRHSHACNASGKLSR